MEENKDIKDSSKDSPPSVRQEVKDAYNLYMSECPHGDCNQWKNVDSRHAITEIITRQATKPLKNQDIREIVEELKIIDTDALRSWCDEMTGWHKTKELSPQMKRLVAVARRETNLRHGW